MYNLCHGNFITLATDYQLDRALRIEFHNGWQPRSQGLSSYRSLRRARRDPGTRWSRAALTIENIREGSSVIRQFVALSVAEFKVSRCAATDIARDV